jgi:hypothetical protein
MFPGSRYLRENEPEVEEGRGDLATAQIGHLRRRYSDGEVTKALETVFAYRSATSEKVSKRVRGELLKKVDV